MEDVYNSPMFDNINYLVGWADEEGGPLALFYYRGVDLNDFELTDEQITNLNKMSELFAEAMNIWHLYA